MASSPSYAATPGRTNINISTADTTNTGATSSTELVAGTVNGRRIRRVAVSLAAAANRVHFYISTDNGTTKRFLCDVLLSAATASATVRNSYVEVPELVGLILQGTTTKVFAATHIAQTTNIDCEYADL